MNEVSKQYLDLIHSLKLEDSPCQAIMISALVNYNDMSLEFARELFEELKKESETQDIRVASLAKTQLGRLVINKFRDIPTGLNWWTLAAEDGECVAQNYLGGWYLNEENDEFNLDKAIYWFQKAADLGYAKSQHLLGCIYSQGIGCTKDKSKAFNLFEKAAEHGYEDSQYYLGLLYFEGSDEVPQNIEKAITWLEKASEQDNAPAQYKLADYYNNHAHNMEKAYYFYRLAAKSGYDNSQLIVGIMYRDGIGVQQNLNSAIEYFIDASSNTDPYVSRIAKQSLGCLYNDNLNNQVQAIPWWEKAAIEGDIESQYNLAIAYAYGGDGVEIDIEKAEIWLGILEEQETIPFIQDGILDMRKQILLYRLQN